jgi:hypothetical protein
MLRRGIPASCIAWNPEGFHVDQATADRQRLDELETKLAEIKKLVGEQLHPVELAIAVAQLTHDEEDPRIAAEIAGISQRTYYRHRDRFLT